MRGTEEIERWLSPINWFTFQMSQWLAEARNQMLGVSLLCEEQGPKT